MKNLNLNFLSTCIFIFCFSFYIFSSFRHFDPDLWGHLKFGEYIFTQGGIPYKDVFAFVPTKELWVNHEWLMEVIFYLLIRLNEAGFFLLFFKAFIFSLTLLIPWVYISKKSPYYFINLLIYLPIILAFSYGTAIRPQISTYLFFALTLLILELDGLKSRLSFITLPIIFVIWVNCHGGVLAGLALVYLYAIYNFIAGFIPEKASEDSEPPSTKPVFNFKIFVLPLVLTAVLIVNPYTYHYYTYIVDAVLMKRPFVDEWGSVFSTLGNFTYLNILVLITSIFTLLNLRYLNKDKVFKILLIILILIVAITHSRHIPFFAIVCAFYLPGLITELLEAEGYKIEELNTTKNILPAIFVVISIFLLTFTFVKDGKVNYNVEITTITTPMHVGYPVNTAIFIKNNKLTGNIITNFNWGEFIIYNLYPDIKVSLDGRYETVYPEEVVEDNMRFISGNKEWYSILMKYRPDFVLVSKYDPVYILMLSQSGWPLIYTDNEGLLFMTPRKVNTCPCDD